MTNKKEKIKGRVEGEAEEIKQTKLMFNKAEALLEKYKTSEDISPEELDPMKTGIDQTTLLALCELLEDVLATKGVALTGKKIHIDNPGKGDKGKSDGRKTGNEPGAAQKKTVIIRKGGKSRKKKIKFVPLHIIAAMVLGDPKYNN